jgi:hypothetical protein
MGNPSRRQPKRDLGSVVGRSPLGFTSYTCGRGAVGTAQETPRRRGDSLQCPFANESWFAGPSSKSSANTGASRSSGGPRRGHPERNSHQWLTSLPVTKSHDRESADSLKVKVEVTRFEEHRDCLFMGFRCDWCSRYITTSVAGCNTSRDPHIAQPSTATPTRD